VRSRALPEACRDLEAHSRPVASISSKAAGMPPRSGADQAPAGSTASPRGRGAPVAHVVHSGKVNYRIAEDQPNDFKTSLASAASVFKPKAKFQSKSTLMCPSDPPPPVDFDDPPPPFDFDDLKLAKKLGFS
jgi:hypothetical protein